MFTENANPDMQTQMFELFSGHGAVSGVFRRAGVATVSYDINMDKGKRTMDFLTEGGFASKPYLLIMNDLSLYELLSNLLTIVSMDHMSSSWPSGCQCCASCRKLRVLSTWWLQIAGHGLWFQGVLHRDLQLIPWDRALSVLYIEGMPWYPGQDI